MTYFQIAWHYMTKNEKKKKSVSDPKSTHVAFCPTGVKLGLSAIRMKNCQRVGCQACRGTAVQGGLWFELVIRAELGAGKRVLAEGTDDNKIPIISAIFLTLK